MSATKFLPFEKYHIAPIEGIDCKSLKRAAKLARTKYRDEERDLKHGVVLGHIARSLGFRGGFGGYRAEEGRLAEFMEEHGLVRRRDVLASSPAELAFRLTYRQLADRLFSSGLPVPKRIFVGVAVFDLLKAAAAAKDLKVGRGTYDVDIAFADVEPAVITPQVPPFDYFISSSEGTLRIQDLMCSFGNLISDQLCDTGSSEPNVAQLYNVDDAKRQSLQAAGRLLQRVLDVSPSGWLEIVPYNDRLAFLKAPDGGYEFVFKGLRDAEFQEEHLRSLSPRQGRFQVRGRQRFRALSLLQVSRVAGGGST